MEEKFLMELMEKLDKNNTLVEQQNAYLEVLVQMEAVMLDVCVDGGPTDWNVIRNRAKAREIINTVNALLPTFNYNRESRADQVAEKLGNM